jgi:hypothetical protein
MRPLSPKATPLVKPDFKWDSKKLLYCVSRLIKPLFNVEVVTIRGLLLLFKDISDVESMGVHICIISLHT